MHVPKLGHSQKVPLTKIVGNFQGKTIITFKGITIKIIGAITNKPSQST